MLVDNNFDSGVAHAQRHAKSAEIAREHAITAAQEIIERFNGISLATLVTQVGVGR